MDSAILVHQCSTHFQSLFRAPARRARRFVALWEFHTGFSAYKYQNVRVFCTYHLSISCMARTNQRARQFQRQSTPQLGKKSQSTASNGSLPDSRAAIIRDAGPECPELEVHTFVRDFLPRVPEINNAQVDSIVRHVKQRTRGYAGRRWTAFPDDPHCSDASETTVFQGLVKVIATIQKAAEYCVSGLVPKTKYISLPSRPPHSLHRHNLTRPDGCFVFLNDRLGRRRIPHWMDIAITGEFKKVDSDQKLYDVSFWLDVRSSSTSNIFV